MKTSTSNPAPTSGRAHKIVADLIHYAIPFVVSIIMVVWLFHKVDIHEVEKVVRQGVNFWWIGLMMILTTLSHIIRGIRWGIQLRAVGIPRISPVAESVSIFGAYALNLIFQSLGEVWRVVFIAKREKAPLSRVIGTDIGDRASDGIMIVLISIFTVFVASGPIEAFLHHYSLGRKLMDIVHDPGIWCAVALIVGAIGSAFYFFRHYKAIKKIEDDADQIWQGIRVLFTMKGRTAYVLLTFAIWICYFFQTYVCFYAFPFTQQLCTEPGLVHGLLPGLIVFVFGSFSMAVPSNGGLGPWNLAVMFALSLYGISDTQGAAFSLVVWACQSTALILAGIFAAIYVSTTKPTRAAGAPSSSEA